MSDEKKLAADFLKKLKDLEASKKDALTLADIRLLVEGMTQKNEKSLYDKILQIAVKIMHLKDEVKDIDADTIAADFLPKAGLRLEEVVKATEAATHTIIDAVSSIQEAAAGLMDEDVKSEIIGNVTKIFEACNFQDITGQHINKVLKTLEEVEVLVGAIIKILPEDFKESVREKVHSAEDLQKQKLLQGPQLSGDAPTQDDIDKLFAQL